MSTQQKQPRQAAAKKAVDQIISNDQLDDANEVLARFCNPQEPIHFNDFKNAIFKTMMCIADDRDDKLIINNEDDVYTLYKLWCIVEAAETYHQEWSAA